MNMVLPPRFQYKYLTQDKTFQWGLDFDQTDRIAAIDFKSNDNDLTQTAHNLIKNFIGLSISEILRVSDDVDSHQYLLYSLKSAIQSYVGEMKAQSKIIDFALCLCHQKSESDVQALISSNTNNPLKLIQDKLKCTLACGSCKPQILDMIDDTQKFKHKFLGKSRAEWVILLDQLIKSVAIRDEYLIDLNDLQLLDVSIYRIKLKLNSGLVDRKKFVRELSFWIRRQTDFSFSIELL